MDDDYEEFLVLVELSGIIDNDFLHTCEEKCKILGIETKNPILQLGHYVFKGEYEATLGTAVLFEEVPSEKLVDPSTISNDDTVSPQASQPLAKNMKLYDMTRQKLNMTRIFLSKKTDTIIESLAQS